MKINPNKSRCSRKAIDFTAIDAMTTTRKERKKTEPPTTSFAYRLYTVLQLVRRRRFDFQYI
jgi:hypothetical protein